MSNWNFRKRSKTKPCVTKVHGFRPSTLVKRFPSQRSSCDSPKYAYDSIVKVILKINLIS